MSKYEIGDKVKFLNQVGGGVVTKVTPDFVFVQDETGFDMPMSPTELIRMADVTGAGKVFNEPVGVNVEVRDGRTEFIHSRQSEEAKPLMSAKPKDPDDEIKMLKSQVANLKDQVNKLRHQLETLQKKNATAINDNILLQYMVSPGEAEVDLHIDMIHEHPADLSAHETFEVQMRFFRTCMNHAVLNGVKRIVFIHGVGKGILKDEIIKELKLYNGIHFFDAPMAKYGVGATEVFFSNEVSKDIK